MSAQTLPANIDIAMTATAEATATASSTSVYACADNHPKMILSMTSMLQNTFTPTVFHSSTTSFTSMSSCADVLYQQQEHFLLAGSQVGSDDLDDESIRTTDSYDFASNFNLIDFDEDDDSYMIDGALPHLTSSLSTPTDSPVSGNVLDTWTSPSQNIVLEDGLELVEDDLVMTSSTDVAEGISSTVNSMSTCDFPLYLDREAQDFDDASDVFGGLNLPTLQTISADALSQDELAPQEDSLNGKRDDESGIFSVGGVEDDVVQEHLMGYQYEIEDSKEAGIEPVQVADVALKGSSAVAKEIHQARYPACLLHVENIVSWIFSKLESSSTFSLNDVVFGQPKDRPEELITRPLTFFITELKKEMSQQDVEVDLIFPQLQLTFPESSDRCNSYNLTTIFELYEAFRICAASEGVQVGPLEMVLKDANTRNAVQLAYLEGLSARRLYAIDSHHVQDYSSNGFDPLSTDNNDFDMEESGGVQDYLTLADELQGQGDQGLKCQSVVDCPTSSSTFRDDASVVVADKRKALFQFVSDVEGSSSGLMVEKKARLC